MTVRIIRTLVLSFALALVACTVSHAADAGGKGGGGGIAAILKHADDLKLTDEQKTKLEALSKEAQEKITAGDKAGAKEIAAKAKDILTAEQNEKMKEYKKKPAASN